MNVSVNPRRTKRAINALSVGLGLLSTVLVPATAGAQASRGDYIFHGGDVVTMNKTGTVAEAAWVRQGTIEAVGTREEVMRHATKETQLIDLRGGALLPGFVDPHLHLDVMTLASFFTDVSACLPDRYETRKHCPTTIFEALGYLKPASEPAGSPWIVGNGIDPAVMSLDGVRSAMDFQNRPAWYIDQYVSKTRPVIILDKSGHLAYANLQAFVAAGICDKVDNCGQKTADKGDFPQPPGKWAVDEKSGLFTGLLQEPQAYVPFTVAIQASGFLPSEAEMIERGAQYARKIAQAGVTTMVNGGTENVPCLLPQLVSRFTASPLLRIRTLMPWAAPPSGGRPHVGPKPTLWDERNEGIFAVTGLKLWADGSAQGCTAALIEPYNQNGPCRDAETGMADYDTQQMIQNMKPYWEKGWPIQIHANGDRAIRNVLNALAALQSETRNDSPITLLHFTVDGNPATGEDMVRQVADLRAGRFRYQGKPVPKVDVGVSHLIGHVAYWGGAFESILDGVSGPAHRPDENGRAARLDATRHELELGVPFSLHSDAPVSPAQPLWYVEQAVTRNTWFYPNLGEEDIHTMPGRQAITIEQALRAVTLEPARQQGLDRYIGSIEKGKAADLVILDKNPLQQAPNKIHCIRVLSTFVGGSPHDWSKEPVKLAADCQP